MAIIVWELNKEGKLTSPLTGKTYEFMSGLETNIDDVDALFFFGYSLNRDAISEEDVEFVFLPRIQLNSDNDLKLTKEEWRRIQFGSVGARKPTKVK